MALPATVYHLRIELSDVDRAVYQSLDLRLARQPSESMPHLLSRVLAFCLCWEEGIAFSKGGLSDDDEPAVSVRDLSGALKTWIEVGTPSGDRLHRASKAAPRVAVFTQHDPALLQREALSRPIHRVEAIEAFALEEAFLEELEGVTSRNARWELLHNGGQIYVTADGRTISTRLMRVRLEG
jgi:uncharacterized protein YaeQ